MLPLVMYVRIYTSTLKSCRCIVLHVGTYWDGMHVCQNDVFVTCNYSFDVVVYAGQKPIKSLDFFFFS